MKCINCYREIPDNLKFCTHCGTKQPLDREAYEREHPELADALSEEELQELERQRQIEEAERQRIEAERLAQEEAERKAQEEAMAAQAQVQAQAIEEAQSAYNGENGYVPESEPVAIENQVPEVQQYQQSTVEYVPQHSSNLIACPDCGHMVSPRAQSCPSCGYPIATIPQPEPTPQPKLVDSNTESQETKGGSSGLYALLIVVILILVVLIIAQFQ